MSEYTYPPHAVAFPQPPPTSNTLSSHERNALIRSSKKLGRMLGDVPRFIDEDQDIPTAPASRPSTSSGLPELSRSITTSSMASRCSTAPQRDSESSWRKRKPAHLPPLMKLSGGVAVDSSSPTLTSPYRRSPTRRASVLSNAPSLISNAPSTTSGSSNSDIHTETYQRRAKLERLRRKLGDEVPVNAVFPCSPLSPVTPKTAVPKTPRTRSHTHGRSRSTHVRAEDAKSITFSISSDESVHTVTLSASTHDHPSSHSHRSSHKSKHAHHASALPPIPSMPSHLASSKHAQEGEDDAGLIRPRQPMAVGSKIGGADFKAARRAKREGRSATGQANVGEMIEMVGFLGGGF
ncbi:hypothetical protein F5I97DRAFT_44285 [Phlebopus sp. FC_14]|nr:hypothetical protein F5I97DRAFT_44285 [Phlebopus sp. FC_14]